MLKSPALVCTIIIYLGKILNHQFALFLGTTFFIEISYRDELNLFMKFIDFTISYGTIFVYTLTYLDKFFVKFIL